MVYIYLSIELIILESVIILGVIEVYRVFWMLLFIIF